MVSEDVSKLTSLEAMMKFLIIGDPIEIRLLSEKFLLANGHHQISANEGDAIVTEAYNIAYAIKTLLR